MRKGLLNKIGMILLMATIVIGGVVIGSKEVKASEVEPRLLEETEHGNCGEPEAYRNWIGGMIYEEVYYSFKNGVLTIYGRSDTPKEHVFDVRFNKILNGYFENCTNIEKVVVNVDEIVFGENAFKGCTNLTTVTMPKVINILSESAFEGCEKLESIIFPDGCHLQNSGISKNCFKNCTSLTSIELPSHCNQINTGVFEGCTNLETVVFEEMVDYRGKNRPDYSTPFNECSNLTTIVMKNKNSDLNDDNSIISIKTMIEYAASASSNFSTIKVPHQYADAAREYIENQLVSDIGRSLEKPIDVVAIYSVAFDNNGYDTAPDSILADGNKSITAPTPLADDTKCFAGWYKEATCENAWNFENDLVTEDITLYAKWNENHDYADVTDSGLHKCTVCGKEEIHTYHYGEVTKESGVYEEGIKKFTCSICGSIKEEPIAKIKPEEQTVTEVISLKTKKGENSANITFKGNGAIETDYYAVSKKGTSIKLKKVTRKGYTFKGWYLNNKKVTTITANKLTGDMTLEARFTPNKYTISYKIKRPAKNVKIKGKISLTKDEKKVSYDKGSITVKGTELSAEGYELAGFTTDKKGTEAMFKPSDTAALENLIPKKGTTITLYSVWKKK